MPTIWGYLEKVEELSGACPEYPGEDLIAWRNCSTGPRQYRTTDSHRQRHQAD